jgi:hypothetical protein
MWRIILLVGALFRNYVDCVIMLDLCLLDCVDLHEACSSVSHVSNSL